MRESDDLALARGCITYPFWVLATGTAGGFLLWPLILGENFHSHMGFSWISNGPVWRWPILMAWWTIIAIVSRRVRNPRRTR